MYLRKCPILKKIAFLFSIILIFCYLTSFTMPVVNAAASGKPGTPILGHDNYDNDGNYTITMNMWWGNNGTSWTLYENDIQVYTGALADGSPNAQTVSKAFAEKPAGTYTYVCYLNNSYGSTSSVPVSVNVNTGGGIVNSGIKITGADTAAEALQLTVSQGTTEFSLSTTGVANPNYILTTSNSSAASCQIINGNTLKINGLKAGRTSLKINETTSNKVRYVGIRVKTSDGKLPGLPDYLSIGSVSEDSAADLDFWKDYDSVLTNKRMDIRYIYLNGGPVNGWKTWGDGNGGRAVSYIRESKKLGMIPFFVYYNIPDGSESYELDKQHIESDSYMQSYFKDLKFALDIISREGGDETVGLILEPDFIGYMMQNSGKQPDGITARTSAIYSAGILSTTADPVFPDTLSGLVKAINYTINKYAPNAYFGWQFNLWASPGITTGIPSTGLMRITDSQGITNGRQAIVSESKEIYKYYSKAGVSSYGADFVSIDKYGLDAGISSPSNPSASTWFWNLDHWNNYLLFNKTLHQESGLPVILWQIPVGHINQSTSENPYNHGTFPDLGNTNQHYEDSAPTFFLGDTFTTSGTRFNYFSTNQGSDSKLTVSGNQITWNSHAREAADAGIISVLFGAGVGNSTDGVGSPPTDSYWWITKVQNYFNNPEPLSGGNPIETVAAPVFTPDSGTYNTAQSVTISCTTDGATIRYTTDGSTPTSDSPAYSAPINVASNQTIKARAFKSGMADSQMAASTYTISSVSQAAAPVFTPGSGTYQSAQNVTISCVTNGATIRYTTDGTVPTASSPIYSGAINISTNQTVKAYSTKSGMTDSAVTTAAYTINSSCPAWAPNIAYALGDLVTYNGKTYKCILAHTSLTSWEPPAVPVLWQLQ
ncbi:MAG: chitobiase/beta-hexosaminidase C-terminal domain-containing protein [Anaerocolumna sp.]